MNKNRFRQPVGRRFTTEGRKTFILCLAIAAVLGSFAVFQVWTRVGVIQRGYALARAQAENERLQREVMKYTLEVESRQSAAAVDRGAHQHLNMAKASRILVLRSTETAALPVAPGTALAQNAR